MKLGELRQVNGKRQVLAYRTPRTQWVSFGKSTLFIVTSISETNVSVLSDIGTVIVGRFELLELTEKVM